jgi:tRNA/rRNA methyltransferase
MGENIGAAARAMWNFGLDRLRLVAPRDGWPNERALALASGAARVVDRAAVHPTTAEAVADLHRVYATTARPRDLTATVMTPEAAMAEARALVAAGEQVGVLFGPERAGLANADIVAGAPGDHRAGQPGVRLAQPRAMRADRRLRMAPAGVAGRGRGAGVRRRRPATQIEVDKLIEGLEARLDSVGFFFPEIRRERMTANLRSLLRRMELTEADVRTLHGVFRALHRKLPGRK